MLAWTLLLYVFLAGLVLFGTGFIAVRYGGPSERWGAAIIATDWIMGAVIQAGTGHLPPYVPYISIEFCVGFSFLLLAFRYDESWTAWVMVMEGGTLFLADGVVDRMHPLHRLYFTLSNILGIAIVGVVLISILSGKWRLERRAARQEATRARIHQETLSRFGADPPLEI